MPIHSKSEPVKWAYEVIAASFENRQPVMATSSALQKQAACFVSLHTAKGDLRGCIGTIYPVQKTLKEEIAANALSAAFRDPRFEPLQKNELHDLDISVDILGEPEEIDSINKLDPKKYGVIVASGYQRGVLLPDLDGIDTVEQQLDIACRKAGIYGEPRQIFRFMVTRYH